MQQVAKFRGGYVLGSGKGWQWQVYTLEVFVRARRALQSWAEGYELFIGSYFFWNAGNSMQRSQKGLLQTELGLI